MNEGSLIQNGVRVILTGKCNYRCFFCHNEGIDPRESTEQSVDPQLIADLVRSGADDITLSGGEPLLEFSKLIEFISGLNEKLSNDEKRTVRITVVTNASLLSPEKLDLIQKYTSEYRMLRFNISLHTPDRVKYSEITGTVDQFDKVTENILLVAQRDIPVSLNYVLLRSHNEKEKEIEEILEFSSQLGAKRIKIIEFLLTELNKRFYSSFSRLEPVMYNNKHRAAEIKTESRRKTSHYYPEYNLEVSFNKCTCALGCISCRKTREIEIVPGNLLVGCIYKSPIGPVTGKTPDQIEALANEQLEKMIARYGDYSPSLVFEPENVHSAAVFPLEPGDSVNRILSKPGICTYREYDRFELGVPPNSRFSFVLLEFSASTHSKLVCYKKTERTSGNVSWKELVFMDPVYDFSRTRADVNRKKIEAMGLNLVKPDVVKEETTVLDRLESSIAVLKKQTINGVELVVLEILALQKGNPPEKSAILKHAQETVRRNNLRLHND